MPIPLTIKRGGNVVQIDWRDLLDSIRVPWRDKGSNVSRGNININCPWCVNDPSFHLGIAEGKEAYFCYREPNRHSGSNFIRLLIALKQNRVEAFKLLNHYRRQTDIKVVEKTGFNPDQLQRAWDRFAPAASNQRCLHYLAQRGFPYPKIACEMYDLRVALNGPWTNRLLFPLKKDGSLHAWTGRALLPSMDLRYKTYSLGDLQTVYCPDASKPLAQTLVIVEGPLDALKVAYTCHRSPIRVAALVGKHLSAAKLLQLRALGAKCDKVLVALDADVSMSAAYQILNEIAQAIRPRKIARAKIPIGYGDPGDIPVGEVLSWLVACTSSLN